MSTLTVPIRIKRGVGTPSTLKQGELAFDENGQRLFIGSGVGTGGNAATVVELTTPPALLEQLSNVAITSGPSDGDVLTYDATAGEWIAQAVAAASVAWADVTSKPTVFTPDTHSHAWGDITSGVPSTFAPSAHASSHHTGGADAITPSNIGAAAASHTHSASDITSGLATVATTGAYSDLSGKPDLGSAAYLDTTDFVESQAASTFGLSLLDDADAAAARTTLGLGSAATSATGDFAAASHGHAWAEITSGVPSTFTPSAHHHTVTLEISGFIEAPEAKTYVLSPSIPAAITITNIKAQTGSGTCDLKLQDDGSDIANTTLDDVGSGSVASPGTAPSASVAAGSKLALVVSDPSSSAPEDLAFTVYYTVTSANNA